MINVRLLRYSLLLTVFLYPVPKLRAADADFAKWWPQFQASVAKSDANAVAQGAAFPIQWENGPIRDLKSADELVQHFAKYFTPELKKMIATKKPEKWGNGEYAITWKARGNEYSVYFKPTGAVFALGGLSEGPP
jgi:hypothetical protein